MKKLFSWILPLVLVCFVSCRHSNEPIVNPIPDTITNPDEIYTSYRDCLSDFYKNIYSITYIRENHNKQQYGVFEYSHNTNTNEESNETNFYSSVSLIGDGNKTMIKIMLSGHHFANTGITEEKGDISIVMHGDEEVAFAAETSIIHSGDKLYLKDFKTQAYICVLQKDQGLIFLTDNRGHTWDAQ